MIDEIGSEFWDVPTGPCVDLWTKVNVQWYLAGRCALQAIISELKKHRTIAMPSWCCESMIKPFADAGFKIYFYPVYWDKTIIQQIRFDCDVLLIMDYFGYVSPLAGLKSYKGVISRDLTHSLFSGLYNDADYYFGSLRKWCGIWSGGYAWAQDGHGLLMGDSKDSGYADLREKAMEQKRKYIAGESKNTNKDVIKEGYLRTFEEAEEILEHVGIVSAAERDIQLSGKIDEGLIKALHRENAMILRSAFSDYLVFPKMRDTDCPMFVPIIVPNGKRDSLRDFLKKHDIYCPIHWPISKYHCLDNEERFLYDNSLSLVCDQRYTKRDMYRIIEKIKIFLKEGDCAHSLHN